MAKNVGTWWIRDGMDERRNEARGFGEVLACLSSFNWTQDHGDNNVLRKDFVETTNYDEKVDKVDIMFMCTHGDYDVGVPSTYGRGFSTSDGTVENSDIIDWGKQDLEYFSTHACRLLYHSSTNSLGRWIPAFERLHYMFGFHTVSYSGKSQEDRGEKFAIYACFHLFIPNVFRDLICPYPIRVAWMKANIEVESSSVKWAYLRANGKTSSGVLVDTYCEVLSEGETGDPVNNREFWRCKGSC